MTDCYLMLPFRFLYPVFKQILLKLLKGAIVAQSHPLWKFSEAYLVCTVKLYRKEKL